MNKKEQLKRLICALYRQDEPEDYTDECMEDMLDNIDFEVLLQAVAHSAKTVYAYEACGVQDCSFNYRSAPLFPQKAVRLYEDACHRFQLFRAVRRRVYNGIPNRKGMGVSKRTSLHRARYAYGETHGAVRAVLLALRPDLL